MYRTKSTMDSKRMFRHDSIPNASEKGVIYLGNKPNILIFMTDQQRGDTSPPYSKAIMPNVENLKQEGIAFSNAYCPSPHCCPSRATFFSGLYPSEHGVWNNVNVGNALSRGLYDGVRLFSEDLSKAGYKMDFSGKWHVSSVEGPEDRGWVSHFSTGKPQHKGKPLNTSSVREWGRCIREAEKPVKSVRKEAEILRPGYFTYKHYGINEHPFSDRKVIDDALRVIRSRKKSHKPWCHFLGTLGPHDPYFVPRKYLDMYNLDDIKLPRSFNDEMSDKPNLYKRTRNRFDQLTEHEHKEGIRHYLAFCSYEDALFGEILDALKETGEVDNTLVIYISDHGDYGSEHGLWCKGLPCFRGAYHIPAVIRWPKVIKNPGRVVDEFISLADFAPTFLEAAGINSDRKFVGKSLMPFVRNEDPEKWRKEIYTQSNGNEIYGIQRSVMDKRWKYVYNAFDYDELYDLENDPDEMVNLVKRPGYEQISKEMMKKIWRFAYENSDDCVNQYIMTALADYGPGLIFSD